MFFWLYFDDYAYNFEIKSSLLFVLAFNFDIYYSSSIFSSKKS